MIDRAQDDNRGRLRKMASGLGVVALVFGMAASAAGPASASTRTPTRRGR